jgi:DNA-directed RNA polymerase subunit RPC12/RpoP
MIEMALIKCPECGKEISDKATKCPNCGISFINTCLIKMKISVVVFIISIIVIIGCSIYISNNKVDAAKERLDNFTRIGTEYYKEDNELKLTSKINLSKNIRIGAISIMIISLMGTIIFYNTYNKNKSNRIPTQDESVQG